MVLEFFTLWREVVWICQEPGADGIPGKHSLARTNARRQQVSAIFTFFELPQRLRMQCRRFTVYKA